MEKICLKIIRWGTYLILFTPFVISGRFFFPFIGPKSLYFMALVEIIFTAYVFLAISSPKYRPKFNILAMAIILFIAVSILAAILGVDFSMSFWSKYERMTGLLMWFHLLAFFLVISSVFQKRDWFKIFGVSVIAATLMSILVLLPKIGLDPLAKIGFGDTRGGATIGNSSFLGSYLIFNVFLALYLFLKTREKLKIFYGSFFVLLTVTLFLSGARAAAFAFFVGMILLFFLKLVFCEKGILKLVGIVLLTLFLVGGTVTAFFAIQGDNIIHKTMVEKFSLSIESRRVVWAMGWKGWQERPWLGWGPENFRLVFSRYFDSRLFLPGYGGDVWYDRAHNIVVDTLVSTGLIGFLSYLGIFASVFYVLWRKYLSQKIGFLTAGVFSVILFSYSVQNLTVFDMVSSLMMFFLILGFVGSIASQKDYNSVSSDRKITFPNPWIVIIVLIFFIISFFNFVIQPLRTDYYIIRAFRTPNFSERISLYGKTLAISPVGKYQIRETIAEHGALKFTQREIAEKIPVELQKQELDFTVQELEKSIKDSPLLYSSYLKLGKVYNIYGRLDSSKFSRGQEVLEKAVELGPSNQQGYWDLSQNFLFQRKPDEAMSAVEKAIEVEPRVQRSHLIAIEVAKIIGNVTGNYDFVKERAEEALKINPSWYPDIKKILEK